MNLREAIQRPLTEECWNLYIRSPLSPIPSIADRRMVNNLRFAIEAHARIGRPP